MAEEKPTVTLTDVAFYGGGPNCTGVSIGPGVRGKLTGVISKGNGRDGFHLLGPGHELVDCVAEDNGRDGVHIVAVPRELLDEIRQELEAGADGDKIAKAFGDRLKSVGRSAALVLGVAANTAQIWAWYQGLT